ncbi:hypothetical protein [Streptomyces sp. NBC_00151]|uniref:hypothetical protein n=1 Tax=Streptomyces sp. NBC_00151 TaxID=2975669 RepID=UPI002DD9B96D|nr:hypothetical protein [Streptomyces sp. NBC_00151]WRZ41867.1 hypothetical protein OG915_29810 [Streptomyces sp. NBC_00151]
MTSRTGYGRPRLVASAAGRGPAVHARYRVRPRVEKDGRIAPRDLDGYGLPNYPAGSEVEIDLRHGTWLISYDAALIAESVRACSVVHLVSDKADGGNARYEDGTAYNANGVLVVLRAAIERCAARSSAATC